jgi:hypothetical protein
MSKLSLLLLIATFALSGGVTAKKAPEQAAEATVAERAEPAKAPARKRPEVIPLNTRGYNLPGPNDPPPAAIEAEPRGTLAAPEPH